jgi:indolepyruvate ferredoxin oxidoreductase beta subunit
MDKVTNILIVGVGGQGVILASEIVAEVTMRAGFDVKKSEVHGMAQRGGSVNSHVRFGSKVYSPVIKRGEVDILCSFEQLETMRYLDFLKEDPTVLLNNQKVLPPSVTLGTDEYPESIPELLAEKYPRFVLVDALDAARAAGNIKAANIAFVGALSRCLNVEASIWLDAISSMLPPELVELNLRAFTIGREENDFILALP